MQYWLVVYRHSRLVGERAVKQTCTSEEHDIRPSTTLIEIDLCSLYPQWVKLCYVLRKRSGYLIPLFPGRFFVRFLFEIHHGLHGAFPLPSERTPRQSNFHKTNTLLDLLPFGLIAKRRFLAFEGSNHGGSWKYEICFVKSRLD